MARIEPHPGSGRERLINSIHPGEVINLLQTLVRIPTVNPPGDVREAMAFCRAVLGKVGFDCQTVELDPTKPNLIATFGTGRSPVVCLNSHMDIVPVGDLAAWNSDPFAAEIRNGRVYGRGALDDKASVAAQIVAGMSIAASSLDITGSLVINLVADEEIDGPNGAALIVKGRHIVPDHVIVGEPTLNRVCIGEKGGGLVEIEVTGRTAHGALPWEGANAIEAMSMVVAALRAELWPKLADRTHPQFHPSSASANGISGGVKDNVVPDRCVIQIDRRFVPGEDPAEALAEIDAIATAVVSRIDGCSVHVRYPGEVNRASLCPSDAPVVRAMVNANQTLGIDTKLTGFSMATDGRYFAAAGYPTIIYGPGDPKLAHVPNESVGIDEVMMAAKAYALGVANLLAKSV